MKSIPVAYFQKPPHLIIPTGFVAGLLGGIIARLWIRWISTKPEFTWSGTLGIVLGFAVFGAVQSIVYTLRRKPQRKWFLVSIRILGVLFSLQLFVAAGAIMFPTVLTASLAVWRGKWKIWLRALLFLIGLTFWVLIINSEIINNFGWSIITVAKILLFGTIYSSIIYALRPTIKEVTQPYINR